MKQLLIILAFLACFSSIVPAQEKAPARNMIIFVMDGYRWRELFEGADSAILHNKHYNRIDSAWTVTKYWDDNLVERRRKLMPFVWDSIARTGQLFGNRTYGSLVNVRNKYWFSYPGRNEAFTGYYDSAVNSNEYPDNPNTNVLEFINQQPEFHGKIATFASWDAVARILNRNRNGMLVNIYGEDVKGGGGGGGTGNGGSGSSGANGGNALTPLQIQANSWQHLLPDIFGKGERLDAGTYALAKPYLLANHPRILYIDFGDNDDFGHAGDYDDYLDAAHYADAMFRDIWSTIQLDPFYKDQTAMLIFPDHGRGIGPGWTSHGAKVAHSNETYLLAIGAGIAAKGEIKTAGQLYEDQFAQTIAALLGFHFTAEHPIAEPVRELLAK